MDLEKKKDLPYLGIWFLWVSMKGDCARYALAWEAKQGHGSLLIVQLCFMLFHVRISRRVICVYKCGNMFDVDRSDVWWYRCCFWSYLFSAFSTYVFVWFDAPRFNMPGQPDVTFHVTSTYSFLLFILVVRELWVCLACNMFEMSNIFLGPVIARPVMLYTLLAIVKGKECALIQSVKAIPFPNSTDSLSDLTLSAVTKSDTIFSKRDESFTFGEYFRRNLSFAQRHTLLMKSCVSSCCYRLSAVSACVYVLICVNIISLFSGSWCVSLARCWSCQDVEGGAGCIWKSWIKSKKDPQWYLIRLQHRWAQVPW